jgi:hypothetical protein
VPPSDIASTTPPDPHNFSAALSSLSSGTQKRARTAVVAAATGLEPGEQVQLVVCGEYQAFDAVAVLTDRRIVIANSRPYAPEFASMPIADHPEVKGWAESGRATLRLTSPSNTLVIGDIKEVDGAQSFAAAVRARA